MGPRLQETFTALEVPQSHKQESSPCEGIGDVEEALLLLGWKAEVGCDPPGESRQILG
jgi:hypothetical protein